MQRTRNSWRAFFKLRPYLLSKRISLKLKMKLFTMCILPVLLYASETWTMKARTLQRLQATQLAMLRRILGVSRMDKMRNSAILAKTEAMIISQKFKMRKWSWAGHVFRRRDDRWTTELSHWWPREDGKRQRGRQKKRWRDDYKRSPIWSRSAAERQKRPASPKSRPRPPRGGYVPQDGCSTQPT